MIEYIIVRESELEELKIGHISNLEEAISRAEEKYRENLEPVYVFALEKKVEIASKMVTEPKMVVTRL